MTKREALERFVAAASDPQVFKYQGEAVYQVDRGQLSTLIYDARVALREPCAVREALRNLIAHYRVAKSTSDTLQDRVEAARAALGS